MKNQPDMIISNKCLSVLTIIVLLFTALVSFGQTITSNGVVYTAVPGQQGPLLQTPSALAVLSSNSLAGPLATVESYLLDNDTNYHGFDSNAFMLFQSAVFSSVKGVPGASSIGNDLGLDVPFHKYNLALDSVTRFEQVFGDVGNQQVGVQYDYNDYQVQFYGGFDVRYQFAGHRVIAVPYVGLAKASTGIPSLSPFIRWSYPITSKPGAGEVDIGLDIIIGQKLYGLK